jgi:hypothetical protein
MFPLRTDKFTLVKLQLKQISSALEQEVDSCHIDLGSINAELYVDQANPPIPDVRISKKQAGTKLMILAGRSTRRSISESLDVK